MGVGLDIQRVEGLGIRQGAGLGSPLGVGLGSLLGAELREDLADRRVEGTGSVCVCVFVT